MYRHISCRSIMFFIVVLATISLYVQAYPDTKLTPAEVVAKHLESIGTPEARARAHGTRIKGNCTLTVKEGGTGQAQGEVVLASQGLMNMTKMVFESEESPTWFKFDGNKTLVSQFRPGRRTSLENFFASFDVVTRDGLLGGTLSESWPLLNLQGKNAKLEWSGIKEVGGKKLIALKYSPHKGGDMKITLFFEQDTFRHVRTEYSQTIYTTTQQRISSGGGGLPTATDTRAINTRVNAVEEFSDFKDEQGLTLPHTYTFELSIQSDVRPALINWSFQLTDFSFSSPFNQAEVG